MCSGFFPRVRTSVSVISRTIVAFCSRVAPLVICTFTYGIFEFRYSDIASLRSLRDSHHYKTVIPTEASPRFFFAFTSCERVGLRSGGTLAKAPTHPPKQMHILSWTVDSPSFLPTMPEQNHIPLLHNVFLPLQPHLRFLPRRRQTPGRQQIIPSHHFRPN